MYEDRRTIEPTGLLSKANKPAYTPKPIHMTFNNSGKPAADHVNVDKEKQWQRNYQEEQLRLQKRGLALQEQQMASGGGGKVICTRYHELGFMPDAIYAADEAFGKRLLFENPGLMFWYWSWAPWWVKHCMHGETVFSQLLIVMFWPLCRAWATEMAYREGAIKSGSLVGCLVMKAAMLAFKVCTLFHPTVPA